MSTDSGNEDSGESNQQSEKTPKGKGFLGILVFLIAVGGVVLIVMSGQDPSIPQIEGYGGNQNPLVGIPNVAIGAVGIFETFMYLLAGGALLVISLIGFAIWRNFERIKAKIVRGKLGRWTLIGAAAILALLFVRWIANEVEPRWTHATMNEQIAETVAAIRGGTIANYAGVELGWSVHAQHEDAWDDGLDRLPLANANNALVAWEKGLFGRLGGAFSRVEYAAVSGGNRFPSRYYQKVVAVMCEVAITDFEKCLRLTRRRTPEGVDYCCIGLPPKGAVYLKRRGSPNADGTWDDRAYEYEFRGEQFPLTVIDTEEKALKLLGEPNCTVNPVEINSGSRTLCYGASGTSRVKFTFSDGWLKTVGIYQISDGIINPLLSSAAIVGEPPVDYDAH
jgi:hypothetical protein